jgi:hypothetical protein
VSAGSVLPRVAGLVGLAWGSLLLARGTETWRAVESRAPDEVESAATMVLGARHAVQGVVQLVAPRASSRAAVALDVLHAASMGWLAAVSPPRRRAALVSGGVALGCASLTAVSRRLGG